MNQQLIANSLESLQSAQGKLREAWNEHKYLRISYKTGKSRSSLQNRHSHSWYGELARLLTEDDALGWKCFCKLQFGVPILRAEDADFREFYDGSIKDSFTYEQKVAAMKYLPVTSLMTKKQLKAYETAMQDYFRDKYAIELTYTKGGESDV